MLNLSMKPAHFSKQLDKLPLFIMRAVNSEIDRLAKEIKRKAQEYSIAGGQAYTHRNPRKGPKTLRRDTGWLHDNMFVKPITFGKSVTAETVYSLIHEIGGWTGRGHKSYLPPREYFEPAVNETVNAPMTEAKFVNAIDKQLWSAVQKAV